jgi:hypothetical protein
MSRMINVCLRLFGDPLVIWLLLVVVYGKIIALACQGFRLVWSARQCRTWTMSSMSGMKASRRWSRAGGRSRQQVESAWEMLRDALEHREKA